MRRTVLLGIACLAVGCASGGPTVVDSAILRPGELSYGGPDPDAEAVQFADWAFSDPSRLYGRPADAARAAASMEYIAGALNVGSRWGTLSAETRQQLLQGRDEVRDALGVVSGTPSQVVVDHLAAASTALAAGDQQAALQALSAPTFNAPAPVILARLAKMPYLRMANLSTAEADHELFDHDEGAWNVPSAP